MNLIKNDIIKYLFLLTVFSLGIALGFFLWNKISVPFNNPWGVVGTLNELKFNPLNNIIRFLVFMLFPAVILMVVYFLSIKKINNICFERNSIFSNQDFFTADVPSTNNKIYAAFYILFLILYAVNTPTYHSTGLFDSFHEGESLGTSVSYIAGQVPYKDFIFCHGVFQDPLRSVLAFDLFGKSIGSARTLESIIKILSFVFLSIFILKIYRGNVLFSFVSVIIMFFIISSLPYIELYDDFILFLPRDVTTYSFLITIPFLHDFITRQKTSRRKLFIINFFFSFIPLASFGYSVDRGFYLFSAYIIITIILYFLFFHRSVFRVYYLISTFLGLLSALALLAIVLKGNFYEFFKYTFIIMPQYKELMDGLIFHIHYRWFFAISVLMALNTFWLVYKFLQELHRNNNKIRVTLQAFIGKYFIEFCLLLLSVLFFRSALGRSGWEHIAYSSPMTYVLSIYIAIKYYLFRYGLNKFFKYSVAFIIMIISVFSVYRAWDKNLFTENFPFRTTDSEFIPDNYKATISYLKDNLNDDEEFFTMTSEASWYYFVDKPCPTRFPVVWFAVPCFYQEEIVEDLKKSNVKFILYRNEHWANAIDGFIIEKKLPLVVEFIKQHYVFFKKIDDNEIWVKTKI